MTHEWNYSIQRVGDAWNFIRPDGQRVSAAPPRPEVSSMIRDGVQPCGHPWPPAPGWDGVPVDYEACVESLWT